MQLKRLELAGFKSFAKATKLEFSTPISAIVGPNGSGKSNIAEAIRWVLGEQSIKSLRGKRGEDLIWNGSTSAPDKIRDKSPQAGVPRSGKASVSLVFDNEKKIFPLDFEEVIITRAVYRDGVNDYVLNGSICRLKDIVDLMASVGLGASTHHIICQGEADRILNASSKERREMMEDALGLSLYKLKKEETSRKVQKTEENLEKVEAVKKEIQPHLNFLKRQVSKAEEAESLRGNLRLAYGEYLAKEDNAIKNLKASLDEKKIKPQYEISRVEREIRDTAGQSLVMHARGEIQKMRVELENKEVRLNELRTKEIFLEREGGKFEGMMELEKKRGALAGAPDAVPVSSVREFIERIEKSLANMLFTSSLGEIRRLAEELKQAVSEIKAKIGVSVKESGIPDMTELLRSAERLKRENEMLKMESDNIQREISSAILAIAKKEADVASAEKNKVSLEMRLHDLKNSLKLFDYEEEKIFARRADLARDVKIATAILGEKPINYEQNSNNVFDGGERETLRNKIERTKIKLEDLGGIGEETLKEFEEVKRRDEFLEKELHDLRETGKELDKLMAELEEKVEAEFKSGVAKINNAFGEFFSAMFNGGNAELKIVSAKKKRKVESEEEDLEAPGGVKEEEGLDIIVNFARKKVSTLEMLSGGERALTSIAILFAMTQVNPPPFLVLDETDAALDEANSKRYGETLKKLSEKTQLIVITHNRETMKQAGILYGVTMGADSVSKLLSIKFAEAETYAGRG